MFRAQKRPALVPQFLVRQRDEEVKTNMFFSNFSRKNILPFQFENIFLSKFISVLQVEKLRILVQDGRTDVNLGTAKIIVKFKL